MRRALLYLAVFTAGMTSLGVELSASRLLGNVFGTTNLVWANIIGLILVYLTAGYFIGGRWADRSPKLSTFYGILAWAALATGLIPAVAQPVLRWAAAAVEALDAAVMAGSFLAVLILFCVPVTLLGCASPFAIRLALLDTGQAGRVSGSIYAVSTLGSIVGTFLPVLVLIPSIGTARTFFVLSLALLLVALVGLAQDSWRGAWGALWMPLAIAVLSLVGVRGPIKSSPGMIFEEESAYNYIQVRETAGARLLLLNEGQAIHSVYDPNQDETFGTWDYFLVAPFFNAAPVHLGDVQGLGIVGLAAGTIARQYTLVYGPIPIDGWEIDPDIIDVGRRFFAMTEPNLNVIVADGRWGLAHSRERYSVIAVDAYRPPYIPWQLTTREFFTIARDHLLPDGVLAINVGRTPDDRRLIDALAGTLSAVFPRVYVVDVPDTFNSMVYATVNVTSPDNLTANLVGLKKLGASPLLIDVLTRSIANLRPTPDSKVVFTDDKAPVEQLVNSIVIRFILAGNLSELR
jgi:spermidine synthase